MYLSLYLEIVCDDRTILHAFAQGKDAIGVGFPYSFLPNSATVDFQVIYESGTKVTEENALVLLVSISQCVVTVGVEWFSDIIISIRNWGVCTGDGSILVVANLETEDHTKFFNSHKELHNLTDHLIPDTMNAFLLRWFFIPKENVASNLFSQLTLIHASVSAPKSMLFLTSSLAVMAVLYSGGTIAQIKNVGVVDTPTMPLAEY